MARIVCAGHVNWDVTLSVDRLPAADGEATIADQAQSCGGSACNVATGVAALGDDPAILGSVGDDEHGHLAERSLDDSGVDCGPLVISEGDTAVKYLVVDPAGEVAVLGNEGANEAFAADDLDSETLGAADHLHLTSQDPDTAAALADRAHDQEISVSFDPGRRIDARDFAAPLARADLVFVNEREAATAIEEYFGPADDLTKTVALKHGAGGAEVLTPCGRYASHDGFPVEAVDTTGAGDAFAAGFLSVWLDGGDDPDYDRCLAVGNACGALAAAERGAKAELSWDRIEGLLAN
ncbi:carbohydrate kinase family protein [Halorientalis halophila]|uniref:carbohydrate kinase family protein n=1 Tax=Halorientalis halophila TaxID=3108499 RepID=UPI003008C5A8